jgi:NAD-dependent dihydropyrimidine dehydrogenase PreA subunit
MDMEKCKHDFIYFVRTTKYIFKRVGENKYVFESEEEEPDHGFIYQNNEYTCIECGSKVQDTDIDFVDEEEVEDDVID